MTISQVGRHLQLVIQIANDDGAFSRGSFAMTGEADAPGVDVELAGSYGG